jgi:site-specific recombinase XerD
VIGRQAKQIQAALGHTSLSEAQRYTLSTDRIKAARAGFATLGGRFAKGLG